MKLLQKTANQGTASGYMFANYGIFSLRMRGIAGKFYNYSLETCFEFRRNKVCFARKKKTCERIFLNLKEQ